MSLEDLTVDQLLAAAQQAMPSHQLLQQLANNPETREQTLRLVKKLNPALQIPEIDARDQVETKIEALKQQLLERDAKDRENQARASIEAERVRLKDQYRFTDADIGEVEKLMMDEHEPIPSYSAAAKVYNASRQAGVPSSSNAAPPVWELPGKDTWGAGIGNRAQLDKIAMTEAYRALNDIKSGKIAGVN
jgi:hypothetical protein